MRKIGEKIWVFERGFRLLGADKNGKDIMRRAFQ
jgi:hypothetical protein